MPKDRFLNIPRSYLVCLLLVVALSAVYGPVGGFEFINLDDALYVGGNPMVRSGLTPAAIKWAFGLGVDKKLSYWHPLAWISHMLDVELYGLNPGPHHLMNLLIHMFNSLLLFVLLRQMTGALWRSACVAALFALHPLNVESVAWVAERKNVLSTFFGLLSLWVYAHYVQRPTLVRYMWLSLSLIAALMAKPMLVTLPFVLLLLDYWPLKRVQWRPDEPQASRISNDQTAAVIRAVSEKIPLLIVSLIAVWISSAATQRQNLTISTDLLPMSLRLANALVAYVKYIVKMIYPRHLAVFYPYPAEVPLWQVMGAVFFLGALSFLALFWIRRRPYFVVGWLWYLGTLTPVLGLIQAGLWPEMADRWGYVPLIGLFLILAWGAAEVFDKWGLKTTVRAAVSLALLTALIATSRVQVGYWRDSLTLFSHAAKVTSGSLPVYNNLGSALQSAGRPGEAAAYFRKVIQAFPAYADAHFNLASALAAQGRDEEAIERYRQVLKLDPQHAKAHYNMGTVYQRRGQLDQAAFHYSQALQANPNYAEAHNNLGSVLAVQGRADEAVEQFRAALRIRPGYEGALRNLEKITHQQVKAKSRYER